MTEGSFESPGSAPASETMPRPNTYPAPVVGGKFPDPVPFAAQYPGSTPQVKVENSSQLWTVLLVEVVPCIAKWWCSDIDSLL
jgi:hypothetical protein